MIKYSIQDAIDAARALEPELARRGLHASIGGSLMYRGDSEKDIDLVIYRHNPREPLSQTVATSVEAAAMVAGFTVDQQRTGSGRRNREVLVTWWGDKRVDLIIA